MIPVLEVTDKPTDDARKAVIDGLVAFNQAAVPWHTERPVPLAVTLFDPETGACVGGLIGATHWGQCHVDLLYVPENLRGGGWGTQVMQAAEAEAMKRGCNGIWLDTFSFQARGFYERLGYQVFGEIADYPKDQARFFLMKKLLSP